MIEQSFKIISLHTLHFHHHLRVHTHIKLKLGTGEGLIKAHLCTNFGSNLINIYRVMIDFFAQKMLKVCHAYRVNHWKELDETRYVGGVIIIGVPFCSLKGIQKRLWKHDTKPNRCQIMQ